MQCPKCEKENAKESKFFLNCGNKFAHQSCAHCGKDNSLFAKFCLSCGKPFLSAQIAEPLPNKAAPKAVTTDFDSATVLMTNTDLSTTLLMIASLKPRTEGKEILIPAKALVLLGRKDPENSLFPDIDLTDLDRSKKVSRRHAQFETAENQYYLKDLGSVNGSFVNDKRLVPQLSHLLQHGDILAFGNIYFTFILHETSRSC